MNKTIKINKTYKILQQCFVLCCLPFQRQHLSQTPTVQCKARKICRVIMSDGSRNELAKVCSHFNTSPCPLPTGNGHGSYSVHFAIEVSGVVVQHHQFISRQSS